MVGCNYVVFFCGRGFANISTQVWQIAQRDYKIGKGKHRTLTKAIYDAIGDHFRALWGKEAGWAHSVLFAADLRTFATQSTQKIEVTEIVEVKKDEEGKEEELLRTVHVKSEIDSKSILKRELSGDENSSTDTKPTSTAKLPKRRHER